MQSGLASRSQLETRIVDSAAVSGPLKEALFGLFSTYYRDVDRNRFEADLRGKDYILLLEQGGVPVGFTTARIYPFDWRGETVSVLFSGDTIVDRAFWGEQQLAQEWLKQVGRLARREQPGRRLVWFLIVKGHRTYRYLPVFAQAYVPAEGGQPPGDLLDLRNALAAAQFGASFDPHTGVIRFAAPQGRLEPAWVEPTARELRLPGVAYFLRANPGFRAGDELACLCELSPANMRKRARQWFDAGYNDG